MLDQMQTDFNAKIDISTIVSILPIALNETKPGVIPSHYHIPACKDSNRDIEVFHVARAKFPVYIDESRPALIVPEPSDILANAICNDFKVSVSHYVTGISEPGLYWMRGAFKKTDVLNSKDAGITLLLDDARRKQNNWFRELVKSADDDWARYHIRRMISDLQVLAAQSLGVKSEWMDVSIPDPSPDLIACKFCFAPINKQAMICMHCRGVLDTARFDKEYKGASHA